MPYDTAPDAEDRSSYSHTAEFYDLVAQRDWEVKKRDVEYALTSLTCIGPFVDIGAGTGISTKFFSQLIPDVEIIAVEPSLPMRSALMSRIVSDPSLRRRVTVRGCTVEKASLPDTIGSAALMGVVGHMTAENRRILWKKLRDRLSPGGRIIVEYMPVSEPTFVDPITLVETDVGRNHYTVSMSGQPAGDLQKWLFTYSVTDDGRPVTNSITEYLWEPINHERLRHEVGQFGFDTRMLSQSMSVLTVP